MEYIVPIFSILIGLFILVILSEAAWFFYLLIQSVKQSGYELPSFPFSIPQSGKEDQYHKEDDGTVPLDQFKPDFSKPVKVRIKEEPEGTVVEEENG